jgi:hypothetical protein
MLNGLVVSEVWMRFSALKRVQAREASLAIMFEDQFLTYDYI